MLNSRNCFEEMGLLLVIFVFLSFVKERLLGKVLHLLLKVLLVEV